MTSSPTTCTNSYCRDGWVERGDNESGGAPAMPCQVCSPPDPLPSDEATRVASSGDEPTLTAESCIEPSDEAVKAAARALMGFVPMDPMFNAQVEKAAEDALDALTAAYAIDLPRREAEVRAATLREVEALREALRFYSDGFAYLTPEGWRRIWRDGGQVAREALAHFNQETE